MLPAWLAATCRMGRWWLPGTTRRQPLSGVESIRAFAGERWQEAVIAPGEEHLLKDTWIGHYEVLHTG